MPHAGRRRHARRDRAEPRRRVSPVARRRARRPDDPVRRPRPDRVSRGGPDDRRSRDARRHRHRRGRRLGGAVRRIRGRAARARPAGSGDGGGGGGGGGEAPDGKAIFAEAGCGGCHTLKAAGATGTVGPNLDDAKPSKELVIDRVTNGKGVMPSFKDSYSAEQIAAVADYVSKNAGGSSRPSVRRPCRGQDPSRPDVTCPSFSQLRPKLIVEQFLDARSPARCHHRSYSRASPPAVSQRPAVTGLQAKYCRHWTR